MRRIILLILLTTITCLTGISAQVSNSKWQIQPIIIDGNGSDWQSIPRFFNSESNVQYEFRNDAQNLYLILKSTDRATQIQLLRAGFAVTFKLKTQPPGKYSIIFPVKNLDGNTQWKNNQVAKNDALVDKAASQPNLQLPDSAKLEGFQFEDGFIKSSKTGINDICFARNKDNREQTTYEFKIPLREFFGTDYVLSEVCKIPLQLQVAINEMSKQSSSKMHGRSSGRGMSGGMRGGGMRGGGMEGGGMNEMNSGGNEMDGPLGSEIGGGNGDRLNGGEMEESSQRISSSSMERKSFNIDFKLVTGQ